MTISDIRHEEAKIEVKAAAVSDLLRTINRQAFDLTMNGILGDGSNSNQKQAAYNWMYDNYDLISAVIFAATDLSDDVYNGMSTLDSMLAQIEHTECKIKEAGLPQGNLD